jgi:glycosyltransferase involved in cell wall biosynthesis
MPEMMEPLDILAVAPLPFYCDGRMTFTMGGPIFYADLLPGLAQLGHRVRVIAQAPAAREGQQRTGLRWDIPTLSVEWFALEYRSGSTPPPSSFLEKEKQTLMPLFGRMVRQQTPNVVMIGRQDLIWNVFALCREYHLPSFLIPHSSPLAALSGGTYPETVKQQLVDQFCQVDCVVAVARHLEELFRSVGVASVCTIPNIADPSQFRPEPKNPQLLAELGIGENQLVISHISNLRAKKRPLDIIAAAEVVLRTNPSIVYLIIGDGPCRQEMEELGRAKGIATSFRYVGEIDHQYMPHYVNLSDIVVLPSEREGASLVYRETQACGRVLLASDIPAAREAVVDGETGMLFRLGDVQDLATKILVLAGNPTLRQQIGEKARAVVAPQTLDWWVRSYDAVLRRTTLRLGPLGARS